MNCSLALRLMIKAVIFDMYETLITHYDCPLYFGRQMAADAGISEEKIQALWRPTEHERTIGKQTLEQTVEFILKDCGCYSDVEQSYNLKTER